MLARQDRPGEWEPVVAQVADHLARLAAERIARQDRPVSDAAQTLWEIIANLEATLPVAERMCALVVPEATKDAHGDAMASWPAWSYG